MRCAPSRTTTGESVFRTLTPEGRTSAASRSVCHRSNLVVVTGSPSLFLHRHYTRSRTRSQLFTRPTGPVRERLAAHRAGSEPQFVLGAVALADDLPAVLERLGSAPEVDALQFVGLFDDVDSDGHQKGMSSSSAWVSTRPRGRGAGLQP